MIPKISYTDTGGEPVLFPEKIAELMGGQSILRRRVRSLRDLEQTVSGGLPKRTLKNVVDRIYIEKGDARRALYRVVPEATFKRRTRLSPEESGKTERLARVIAFAEHVWDDRDDAREWLMKPHPELGGKAPVEAALTELGARQSEEILDKLFFGLPV
jgi:putative toxin-antitoxin system antitoxin component (TIGR02293 family)